MGQPKKEREMTNSETSIWDMMDENRKNEMRAICRFILSASTEEMGILLEEMRCVHDNLMAFNPRTKLLCEVKSISINGEAIQMNLDDE
jgi:hypothetical protein